MPSIMETIDSELLTALQESEAGRHSDALARFEQMLRREMTIEQHLAVLVSKAKCLELLGRFQDARQAVDDLREVDREGKFRLEGDFEEIMILFTEGKLEQAVHQAELAFVTYRDQLKTPEYEDHEYELSLRTSLNLVTLERFADAIHALTEFLPRAREEDKPRIHLFLGIAYEFSGNDAEAVANFRLALAENAEPSVKARAHYHLGAESLKRGALAWSKRHFQSAENLKQHLNFPVRDLYDFLYKVCDRLGEHDEARHYLKLSKSA
jgi:tetratricopeptide (TPR) repeat protein